MTRASRALLRESDPCSRPDDSRTRRRKFGRTRGARYRIAAVLVGKRLRSGMLTSYCWRILGHGGGSRVTGVVGAA